MGKKRGCSGGCLGACLASFFVMIGLIITGVLFIQSGEPSRNDETTIAPSSVAEILVSVGYSEEHASEIESVLNSVGITSIEIFSMSGEAENGLNAMSCYPNGSNEDAGRFTVTTENGVVFYVGFRDEDLYDSSQGGVLKQYSEVPIPETDVSSAAETSLMMMAEEVAAQIANYPATVKFNTFAWGFWRNDRVYAVQGTFTCTNAFGVEEEHVLRLVCEASEDNSSISAKEVYLDGTLVRSAE